LVDLFKDDVIGSFHYGEEVQDPEKFRKSGRKSETPTNLEKI